MSATFDDAVTDAPARQPDGAARWFPVRATFARLDRAVAVARAAPAGGVLPGSLAFASVASLGAASGGYFETAWGWSALALLWVAALALLLRTEIRLARLEIGLVAGLVALGAWTLVTAAWDASLAEAVREGQRTLVYVAGVLAALALIRSRSYSWLIAGAWAGSAALSTYALATRLFAPDPGTTARDAYRLAGPLDYWNALGILAALGVLLALGLAARAPSRLISGLAAGSIVPLLATIYFTFGRGPWLALGAALAAAIALDPRRLQLISITLLLAAPGAIALWLAFHSDALTQQGSSVTAAEREGQRLAVALALLSCMSAAGVLVVRRLEQRLTPGRSLRLAFGGALLLAVSVALLLTFARYGTPQALVAKGYASLSAPPPETNGDLSTRLFDVSSRGRVEQWRMAQRAFEQNPWLGSGAGTYEQYWLQHRPHGGIVRDAHSLYLETAAELGMVGLALLLVALAAPLAAALKARRHPLVPAACAAYVAYLVHAAIDWDWEVPAVTLAALFCACAILAAARREGRTFVLGTRARGGMLVATLALATFAFVGLLGNQALAASRDAEDRGRLARAESEARTAIRWAPWSAAGWERLAGVRFAENDLAGARAALLEAIDKEPGHWGLWYDLGVASQGGERLRAYREAARLNPLSQNVAVLRSLRILPPLAAKEKQ